MRTRPVFLSLLCLLTLAAAAGNAVHAVHAGRQDPGYQEPPPQDAGAYQNFTPDQLDNLLAPIALYPDPLLAQVLVAATFPDQIDEASRFLRAGANPNAIDDQPWDVSVKAVAKYPTVLYMMDNRLDWTTSVGQAYVNQSTDVQESIQRLRAMAHDAGTLQSGPQIEVVQQGPYWDIWPVDPRLLYVPIYDPAIVFYGRPGWYGPYITYGVGFPIGSWLIFDFDWGGRGIYYHGWGGDLRPWAVRCRPYVQINNVYVNDRYRNVVVNRTVVNRTVNVENLNRFNTVHRDVTYTNAGRTVGRAGVGAGGSGSGTPGRPVNNQVIQRNINTNDARIQDFRGREGTSGTRTTMEGQGRPAPQEQPRFTPQAQPRPEARSEARPEPQSRRPPPRAEAAPAVRPQSPPAYRPSPPSAFNVERGTFDPGQASQRGQASRQEMSRPSPSYSPPPVRSAPAPRPSGGGRRP
jgi:hypothetical protein